jgi:aspartate kinase
MSWQDHLVVQKYGGSSVADADRVKRVAQRVAATRERAEHVVVVVSALGDTTDALLDLAHRIHPDPPAREMDMLLSTGEQVSIALLAMALDAIGVPAISLTGAQAGIHTDSRHRRAAILRVDTRRILRELGRNQVVVVAGFQGRRRGGDVTTLGRGGSDLTAVALAHALGADRCEIYSDVAGIYTADPRVVPKARKLRAVRYEEMMEMAALGAQVLQRNSVAYAQRHGVVIEARSTFSDEPGTLVGGEEVVARAHSRRASHGVTGLALSRSVTRLAFVDIPDRPGVAAALFEPLAREGIAVDMIVQSVGLDGKNIIALTVEDADASRAHALVRERAEALGGRSAGDPVPLAKISAVGMALRQSSGAARTMFAALAREGINIEGIATSEIRISCLVAREAAERGLRAVHAAFGLDEVEEEEPVPASPAGKAPVGA